MTSAGKRWKKNYQSPSVVYVVTNSINGKKYIGVTSKSPEKRLLQHFSAANRGGNGAFYRAIRKYGREVFFVETLVECLSYQDGLNEEVRQIAIIKPEYNSTMGGDGQHGRVLSEESRRKISAAKMGNCQRLGVRHSKATIDTLRALSNSSEAKERWEKYRHLGPKAYARKVKCVDTGQVFGSATDAARSFGVSKSALIEMCLGKRYRKSVGGLKFEYMDTRS